jgi:carboxypeptidase C (cathepsin A)
VTNFPGSTPLTVDMPFLVGHSIISNKMYNSVLKNCQNINSPACQNALDVGYLMLNDVNIYGVYYDCFGGRPQEKENMKVGGQVPCIDSQHAHDYLNRMDVMKAIHVNTSISWSICNSYLNQIYNRTQDSMVPIYKFLLSHKIRVLIYSGDTDFAVPFLDSQIWTSSAGLTEIDEWHQWFFSDSNGDQVAGAATVYKEGLTFLTIKGSGHMVPQFAPKQALEFFTRFLKNQSF